MSEAKAIYLAHGDDDYRVQEAVREWIRQLCPPEQQAESLETIDGAVDNAGEVDTSLRELVQSLFTLSMFGDRRVVHLRHASFFNPNKIPGTSAAAKEAVASLVEKLKAGAPGNILIISCLNELDKRTTTYKFLAQHAEVKLFKRPKKTWEADAAAESTARDMFKDAKLSIHGGLLKRFLQRTGPETRQIATEVEKLSLYLGDGGTVSAEAIDLIVSPAREAILWDFADAVALGRGEQAMALAQRLFIQKESPVTLIIQLVNRFRELLLIRECIDKGWLDVRGRKVHWSDAPDAAAVLDRLQPDLRKIHPFRLSNLANQSRTRSAAALRNIRDGLIATHEKMVSSRLPADLLLEISVLRATASGKK